MGCESGDFVRPFGGNEIVVYVGVMNRENKRFLTTTWRSEARSLDEMCEAAADCLGARSMCSAS